MSDRFYKVIHSVGSLIFWASSKPTVLHLDRVPREGPFILAANHHSPYDVPLLMRHTPRLLDFVSITEVFRNPFVAWFYGSMNAFPHDRSKPDSPTVRTILERLRRGRVVAMFPEGGIRHPEDSVTHGGRMRPGVARLAEIANVPILPAVVVSSRSYQGVSAWLPVRAVRYGLIYGEPLSVARDLDNAEAAKRIEGELKQAFVRLHGELSDAMERKAGPSSGPPVNESERAP